MEHLKPVIELSAQDLAEMEKAKAEDTGPKDKAFYVISDGVVVHGTKIRKMNAVTFSMLMDLKNAVVRGETTDEARIHYNMLEFIWVHAEDPAKVAAAVLFKRREEIAGLVAEFIGSKFGISQLGDVSEAATAMIESVNIAGDYKVKESRADPNVTHPAG